MCDALGFWYGTVRPQKVLLDKYCTADIDMLANSEKIWRDRIVRCGVRNQ